MCHHIIILEMALLHNLNICKRCWIRILKSGFREMSAYSTAPTTTSTPKPVKRKLRSQTEEVMTFICVFHHCFYSTEMSCKEFVHLAIFFLPIISFHRKILYCPYLTLLSICYLIYYHMVLKCHSVTINYFMRRRGVLVCLFNF